MNWLPAAFISGVIFGCGGFLLKVGSHKNYPGASMYLGLYLTGSLVLFFTLMMSGNAKFTGLAFLFAVLVGFGSYYGNSFLVRAYDTGPASITSPLMSTNILLVILLSAILYHEQIAPKQYIGIGLMMVAISLLGFNFQKIVIKSRLWLVFVVLSVLFVFLREGGLKIAHESGLNNQTILFLSYVFASALALTRIMNEKRNNRELLQPVIHKHAFLLGTSIGVFSATGLSLLAYAIARGPASIIIPVFSVRNFVAIILIVIFYREKLTRIQWIAVCLLISGIFFISPVGK